MLRPSLLKSVNDSVSFTCRRWLAAGNFPPPDFDWDYLLHDASIEDNIVHRKGVGDIQRLRRLVADSIDAASSSSSSFPPPTLAPDLLDEALRIPNATHPDVPIGDETQSRVVAEFNSKRSFSFPPKTHVEIGFLLKGLRTEDVGLTTGKKSYYLMNDVATLERALVKYALSILRQAGFRLISVPDILRHDVIRRCGFETDNVANNAVYKVKLPRTSTVVDAGGNDDNDDDNIEQNGRDEEEFCLSGTAEMGIAGFLKDTTFRASELPLKIAAVSRCFRSEMSTRAIDRGLYRVLQFTKVEMFCLTRGDVEESEAMLTELLTLQRRIFEPLGICCRVLEMSTQELGAPAYHKYDVEAWIESRDAFSEISSTSNCTDYQSRRLGFRYIDDQGGEEGKLVHCHSLNGTACAVPRLIQTILEHHQLENGEVTVPEVLVPFCRNKRKLELKPEWPVYFYKDFGEKIPALNTRDKP